jgi:hypothetical protein
MQRIQPQAHEYQLHGNRWLVSAGGRQTQISVESGMNFGQHRAYPISPFSLILFSSVAFFIGHAKEIPSGSRTLTGLWLAE